MIKGDNVEKKSIGDRNNGIIIRSIILKFNWWVFQINLKCK